MRLRDLKQKDAPLMLEWMHDPTVVENLKADFLSKSIDDCESFIISAQKRNKNLHLAITDDNDEYMGTVSLKNINNHSAEFGIIVRRCAMGKGYSKYAMNEIIRVAFEELDLKAVYWCVNPQNYRAVRFYEKNEYKKANAPKEAINYTDYERKNFYWYEVCL